MIWRPGSDRIASMLLIVVLIIFVGVSYHHHLMFKRNLNLSADLAIHYQSLLSTLEGRLLINHIEGVWIGSDSISYLGSHVSLVHLIYLPVLAVLRSPDVLVMGNLLLITMIAMMTRQAKGYGFGRLESVCVCCILLYHPYLMQQAYLFHPELLVVPLQVLMIHSFSINRMRSVWVCSILILLCREEMALYVILFSLFFLINVKKHRIHGISMITVSLLMFVVDLRVVLPHFAGNAVHAWRYQYLIDGVSLDDIMKINWVAAGRFFLFLSVPFMLIFLRSAKWAIIAIGAPLHLLLSSSVSDFSTSRHYSIVSLVPMTMGYLHCLSKLDRRRRWSIIGAGLFAIVSLNLVNSDSLIQHGRVKLNPLLENWMSQQIHPQYDQLMELLAHEKSIISLNTNLIPFASNNTQVYPFPNHIEQAELIVFDPRPISSFYPYTRKEAYDAIIPMQYDSRYELIPPFGEIIVLRVRSN